jgi:hypothetical protein
MKSITEVYQALLDGKTLIHKDTKELVDIRGSMLYMFNDLNVWEIYKPEWEMKPADWLIYNDGSLYPSSTKKITRPQEFGMKFHTKEAAEQARDQMRRSNLLRYWVSTMQSLDEGTHYLYEDEGGYYVSMDTEREDVGKIYMTEDTAQKIREALNSGKLELK